MTEGLLYVQSEPGSVPLAEFNDWYDNDHGPARLALPEIRSGYRYRAIDAMTPSWLAWYELDIDVLDGAPYQALRAHRSEKESSLIDRLTTLDRRVYALTEDHGTPGGRSDPPPIVLCVAMNTTDEPALDAWYREEHIPILLSLPGWRRTRRYRAVQGTGQNLLAFHEIDTVAVFDSEAYRAAVTTERRASVMQSVTARSRRLFGYHNTVRGTRR